jgi:hypothetical protein
MRSVFAVTLFALFGCKSSNEDADDRVLYRLEGALNGAHDIEAIPGMPGESIDQTDGGFGGARIGCSLVNATDDDTARGQVFLLSAVENYGEVHGAGVYLKVQNFHGAGSYALAAGGRAWVFDLGHIQACARAGDQSCYQGVDGCTIEVTKWDFAPGVAQRPAGYPESVSMGIAEGSFTCRRLVNATTSATVSIITGSFRCHAGDWTK